MDATKDHFEIIEEFNRVILDSKKTGNRITQVMISEKTGIDKSHLNKMLKDGSGMHIKYACAIAKALGLKLVTVKRDIKLERQQVQNRIDEDLRKALTSEQENSKSLREQNKWLRSEYEKLREKYEKKDSIL